ncbi:MULTISPECIES: hypothetical protein [Haloferax]|uniref:DUF7967 domain-containing protein n=1 Tax=Haloferax marinum TaxID=2666143 RepID=A0A6A8G786_9EURY|nr:MULTISPECIES: hypothetical protein [Haloferax]KAB1197934.1 hypothetical protein Hfx1150_10555 [Haloferax sp. CBA1150]MRW96999.1 hypothetical protein [Haloferax marinum]
MSETVQAWLVERTYSDDEQNIIILVYATTDGTRYHRKERSLTSFESDIRDTYAAIEIPEDELGRVGDEETRANYAAAAQEMAETHDPTDVV